MAIRSLMSEEMYVIKTTGGLKYLMTGILFLPGRDGANAVVGATVENVASETSI